MIEASQDISLTSMTRHEHVHVCPYTHIHFTFTQTYTQIENSGDNEREMGREKNASTPRPGLSILLVSSQEFSHNNKNYVEDIFF